MRPHYLLIDGHSVIYAIKELRLLHLRKPVLARDALINDAQQLHDTGHWRVTLVFDGKLGRPQLKSKYSIIVAYSQENETADCVIERTVAGNAAIARDITVVTADQAERRTVEAWGASTASPDWLLAEMEAREIQLQLTLLSIHQKSRW